MRRRGLDGIVCGHIHRAGLVERDGLVYANDGDWVESLTALAEDHDGLPAHCDALNAPARLINGGAARRYRDGVDATR